MMLPEVPWPGASDQGAVWPLDAADAGGMHCLGARLGYPYGRLLVNELHFSTFPL